MVSGCHLQGYFAPLLHSTCYFWSRCFQGWRIFLFHLCSSQMLWDKHPGDTRWLNSGYSLGGGGRPSRNQPRGLALRRVGVCGALPRCEDTHGGQALPQGKAGSGFQGHMELLLGWQQVCFPAQRTLRAGLWPQGPFTYRLRASPPCGGLLGFLVLNTSAGVFLNNS